LLRLADGHVPLAPPLPPAARQQETLRQLIRWIGAERRVLQGVPAGGMPPPHAQPLSDDEERTGSARLVVPPWLMAEWASATRVYRQGVAAREARAAAILRVARAMVDLE
jgi:hypothetical protein